jgi:hypothetical protein
MKKVLSLLVAVVLGMGALFANPVDVNTAKSLGQKFVQAKFEMKSAADLQLYYTVTSDNGEPCAYVFNMGNEGFVIVAASDNVRPILGYSNNGPFDASNPNNGAMYMLETYKNSISYAIESNLEATPDIAAQWKSLENCGRLNNKKASKVGPLVATKWNQSWPYNMYAPETTAQGNSGGHCWAGCVATAMSQVMKYWDHPIHGTGSHSYYCYGFGQQSANFGATTYQWDIMPNSLGGNATQEQKEAVALLMYHCAVSVNMMFAADGSGAYSADVPPAMASYFDYGNCVQKSRGSYSLTNWVNMLKAEFDMGRPVYYSGQGEGGGHAFVADGYDEEDFIHFNFGWGGSDDDFYQVDAIDYSSQAAAIFNYVPTAVYNNTVQAPSNLTATKTSDVAQEATLSWTNPTKTMNNQTVSSYDQIVVFRDGVLIHTIDNPTPGATMTYVDSTVPCYSTFEYRVYAIKDGVGGSVAKVSESFGPTCEWKIIATSNNMSGWKSGTLVAYDGAGREIDRFTMTSNNPTTYNMNITLGKVWFTWKQGSENVSLTFKIKDAAGTVVYQYEGNSDDIPEGVLYQGNNSCGNPAPTEVPGELFATKDGDNIVLTWTGSSKATYGYNIYRDGVLFELAHETEFVDVAPGMGGHCYEVCYLTDGGESVLSNEACANAGEGCEPGSNLWYEVQNNLKPTITWDKPEDSEGLSGYAVYRKEGENGTYTRIKLVAANKNEYKETKTMTDGVWYYYRVIAAYSNEECSAPFKAKFGNQYYVKYLFSTDGVDENMSQDVEVYPNPAKDMLTVKAENLSSVVIYNSLGQKVLAQTLDVNETTIDLSGLEAGIYMVRIVADGNEVTRKVSVAR